MTDELKNNGLCAHLNISWKPVTKDGITNGKWSCNACGTLFVTEHFATLAMNRIAKLEDIIRRVKEEYPGIGEKESRLAESAIAMYGVASEADKE